MKIITWNMQGASDSDSSKWRTLAKNFFITQKANVVCLQECGWPLANPDFLRVYEDQVELPRYPTRFFGAPPDTNYTFFLWWPFSDRVSSEPLYVFWVETDDDGHRVNLTIVSVAKPQYLLYIEPVVVTATFTSRPAIGINLGVPNVFCIHANSRTRGSDAPRLLDTINQRYKVWFAAGDFNRAPEPPWNTVGEIWPPDRPTHDRFGKLDYMVAYTGNNSGTVIQKPASSDHYPVEFVF